MTTYTWRTDAASGEIESANDDAALARLIADGEWADIDSAREAQDIADGGWLFLRDPDGIDVLRRGTVA
jgi:hypothetical protein